MPLSRACRLCAPVPTTDMMLGYWHRGWLARAQASDGDLPAFAALHAQLQALAAGEASNAEVTAQQVMQRAVCGNTFAKKKRRVLLQVMPCAHAGRC